jgi:hypothetical protein
MSLPPPRASVGEVSSERSERDGGGVFGGLCFAPSVFRAARHLPHSLSRTGRKKGSLTYLTDC